MDTEMLTELCAELKNWFDRRQLKVFGDFCIENGQLQNLDIPEGQYFRIVDSTYNDGVYKSPAYELHDETFTGAIWYMAVPAEVLRLADDIAAWRTKYEGVDSQALSPYTSESFSGYSYSKSGGGDVATGAGIIGGTWQAAFAQRLRKWRKI